MKKCASLEDHNHVGNEAEFLAEKIMLEKSVKAQVLELKYFKCCDILQYWLAIPFILPSIFYFLCWLLSFNKFLTHPLLYNYEYL